MAIYQFYLAAIPKKGAIEYFGSIPSEIRGNPDDSHDQFELMQHQCWATAQVDARGIIQQIDQKLDRASWGNDRDANTWKTETEDVDNDVWISTNPEKQHVVEFSFRADLRQPRLKFLLEMIELARANNLLFADRKGNLVVPEIEEVLKLVAKSNARRFLNDPYGFLTDLGEGNVEIE